MTEKQLRYFIPRLYFLMMMLVAFLNFRRNSCSGRKVFASLPSVYLAAIFLVLCLSVCSFHSLAAGHRLHSPSRSETAVVSIQSPQKQISVATASAGTTQTFSRRKSKPKYFQGFTCTLCTTRDRSIPVISVTVMVVCSPLSVGLFVGWMSQNISACLRNILS